MFSKKYRVSKNDIDLIFKDGKSVFSPSFNFKFILTPDKKGACLAFIAPKSVAKLAVKRNLLRRRGYRALTKYSHLFPLGLVGVFVFKKFQDNIVIIDDEIKNILNKIPLEAR